MHAFRLFGSALFAASESGHLEVVRELLKHDNVDVNATGIWGLTALMEAI